VVVVVVVVPAVLGVVVTPTTPTPTGPMPSGLSGLTKPTTGVTVAVVPVVPVVLVVVLVVVVVAVLGPVPEAAFVCCRTFRVCLYAQQQNGATSLVTSLIWTLFGLQCQDLQVTERAVELKQAASVVQQALVRRGPHTHAAPNTNSYIVTNYNASTRNRLDITGICCCCRRSEYHPDLCQQPSKPVEQVPAPLVQ
jgi:hypothetical protein